ncbi:GPW/gp25 family protein [Streptomyces lavendulae]|uniref:GPW/gp25 family protein n=1 Tax=Streptomyces lavendulae TaxID=1914 RepID=UPI0033DC8F0F
MRDTSMTGNGWSFAAGLAPDNTVALATAEDDIEQAIHLILATRPGERAMRPEYGCDVHHLIFAPADATTAGQAVYETRRALERWEPRIDVTTIDVSTDDTDDTVLYLDIHYTIRTTNSSHNLVFPFYVIPSENTVQPAA